MAALQYDVSGQNIQSLASNNSSIANYASLNGAIGSASTANYSLSQGGGTAGITNAIGYSGTNGTLWQYWQNGYYPYVIKESYPVYIQERAMDKGKQAFEILKALMDKGLVKIDKVKDFIEAMDTLLKTL